MTLTYLDAIILFLSGWQRKEGIAIKISRKKIEGLADDDDKLHDRLATLEDTYSKAQIKSIKGYQGLLEILEAQLGSTYKAHRILKELEMYFLKTGAVTCSYKQFS
jgi:hypothetical protein